MPGYLQESHYDISNAPAFRVFVGGGLKSGWYFVVSRSQGYHSSYIVVVENGYVTADYSEADNYGYAGQDSGEVMYKYAGKNKYSLLNREQILRKTPDGRSVALTWYKNLGE